VRIMSDGENHSFPSTNVTVAGTVNILNP
jgi:hypothetical protein